MSNQHASVSLVPPQLDRGRIAGLFTNHGLELKLTLTVALHKFFLNNWFINVSSAGEQMCDSVLAEGNCYFWLLEEVIFVFTQNIGYFRKKFAILHEILGILQEKNCLLIFFDFPGTTKNTDGKPPFHDKKLQGQLFFCSHFQTV